MSTLHLDTLFHPRSIAVIGATDRAGSVGRAVLRNLLAGGFPGPVLPVNPRHASIAGVLAYPDVAALPLVPDVAVLCTPARTIPGLVDDLGRRGTRAAVVITAGLARERGEDGRTLADLTLAAAGRHRLRLLGPNCVGLVVPGAGLNASFAAGGCAQGHVAFVAQSGALCTAVLDWARDARVGFSAFVSLGDAADVDFADVIDHLATDGVSRAILLYVESVRRPRKFISAARAAARGKPVLAVKSGRVAAGRRAAASHTGALTGSDEVYEAALRRAGVLRVHGIDDLFAAVETLALAHPPRGRGVAILTNGGGPGVLATDALILGGAELARLGDRTLAALDAQLPADWSHGNPVDVVGDGGPERLRSALVTLLADPAVDAVIVLHCPTGMYDSADAARAVAAVARESSKCVLTCWLGGPAARDSAAVFAESGVPTYASPERAVEGFLQLIRHARAHELLLETPASAEDMPPVDTERARTLVQSALGSGRTMLSEPEAKDVLAAFGIPVVPTRVVATPDEAVAAAEEIGYPVAVKIVSPDVTHKTDVGGVALDLPDGAAVRAAATAAASRLQSLRPEARLTGFCVQPMVRRMDAFETIVGATTDRDFGPVVLFGHGGVAVEQVADRAVALPPLNTALALDLIERTRLARLLHGFRNLAPADLDALARTLVQISRLVCEVPEVVEIDVNPLLVDAQGVIALDARIVVAAAQGGAADRLAILPYPAALEEWTRIDGRRLLLRPIRPEDEHAHRELFERLDPESVRFRLLHLVRDVEQAGIARCTQIDYDREMAFIATERDADGDAQTLGVVRAVADTRGRTYEFGIVVDPALTGRGLGRALLDKLVRWCRSRDGGTLVGHVDAGNERMLTLARDFAFAVLPRDAEGLVEVRLDLAAHVAATEPSV